MRIKAFFSLPIFFLAVIPTQLTATVRPSPLTATTATRLIAQQSRTSRIRFARGANAAVVEDSVVRGTRDIYLLRATRYQTLTINITSLEKNAVFDIQSPNGRILRQEATSWRGALPATGDYKIIVGGIRGNASYRLRVSVK